MTKLLFAGSLVALLCAPALADSPASSRAQYQVDARVDLGKDARAYTIRLADDECATASAKTGATSDEVRVCARQFGAVVQLHVNWTSRQLDREVRNDSVTEIARGASFDLKADGATLHIALR